MASLLNVKFSFALLVIAFFGFMAVAQTAEAKRFGGGKSFGFQKQVAPKNYNKPKEQKQTPPAGQQAGNTGAAGASGAAAGTAAKSGASKWLGPLAGIAAGGLLAAMLFGDGFDGIQLFDILLFALIAFVLFKLFTSMARKKLAQQQGYAASGHQLPSQPDNIFQQPQQRTSQDFEASEPKEKAAHSAPTQAAHSGSIIGADLEDGVGQGVSNQAEFFNEIPAWFKQEEFVEGAKHHFMNLQKAWDEVNLPEIESYCTADLYTALQQELAEVAPGTNQTVIDELDAEIAAMAIDGDYLVVSVRFSGFIDEDGKGAHAFNEVWHIRRLANDEGNWLVAGIQQNN